MSNILVKGDLIWQLSPGPTDTHTTDQLLYKDNEVFGNNNKIKKLSHNISTVGSVQILQL